MSRIAGTFLTIQLIVSDIPSNQDLRNAEPVIGYIVSSHFRRPCHWYHTSELGDVDTSRRYDNRNLFAQQLLLDWSIVKVVHHRPTFATSDADI